MCWKVCRGLQTADTATVIVTYPTGRQGSKMKPTGGKSRSNIMGQIYKYFLQRHPQVKALTLPWYLDDLSNTSISSKEATGIQSLFHVCLTLVLWYVKNNVSGRGRPFNPVKNRKELDLTPAAVVRFSLFAGAANAKALQPCHGDFDHGKVPDQMTKGIYQVWRACSCTVRPLILTSHWIIYTMPSTYERQTGMRQLADKKVLDVWRYKKLNHVSQYWRSHVWVNSYKRQMKNSVACNSQVFLVQ